MLLLYPPTAKTCEPPAGITYLAGTLREHQVPCTVIDLNLECFLDRLDHQITSQDTWSKRAFKNRKDHIEALKSQETYANISKYKRAVNDLNHLLNISSPQHITLSHANYEDLRFSPTNSSDLIHCFNHPEENVYFHYFSSRLQNLFADFSYKHVGISLNYLSQALSAFSIAGFIRQLSPSTKLILGGGLVTSWLASPSWTNHFAGQFDHIIAGPGESKLLSYIGKERTIAPNTPDYSDLPLDDYLAPGFILPYSTSTGCYWNKCAFCPERAERNLYHAVKQDNIVDQLRLLTSRYRPKLIHFLDNSISVKTMKTLIKNPPGTQWYGFTRICKQLTDRSFCQQLAQSGCVMLKLGIESGCQEVLDNMEKGIKLETVSASLQQLHHAGIATYVYLLFGTPTENRQQAAQTLQFTVDHWRYINFLNLAIFNMPINSPESDLFPGSFFDGGNLSLYRNFTHPKGWDRKKIRHFLSKEFKQQPEIKKILLNHPPHFDSNHAPFFHLKQKNE